MVLGLSYCTVSLHCPSSTALFPMNLGQGGFETGLQGRGARRVQKAGPSMPFFVIYDQGGCFTYNRPCHEL